MWQIIGNLRIELQTFSHIKLDETWRHSGMLNEYSRIYFVLKSDGATYISSDGKRNDLQKNHLYLTPAGTLFDCHCEKSTELYFMHIKTTIIGGIEWFRFLQCPLKVKITNTKNYLILWKRIKTVFKSNNLSRILELDALIRQLLLPFYKEARFSRDGDMFPNLQRFSKLLGFIEENLASELSLPELAGVVHLQPAYLSHLFKQELGVGLRAFILQRRIERAQELMRTTEDSLDQIGSALGFNDGFHFSKTFKRLTGMAPSQFRKQASFVLP